jgi:hypothetical protein
MDTRAVTDLARMKTSTLVGMIVILGRILINEQERNGNDH